MRKLLYYSMISLASTLVVVPNAAAQSFGVSGQLKPGDGMIYNSVTMHCPTVKFRLIKIHENDGLARVNAGQHYDLIATKLMARFNAKLAENRLSGGELFNYAAEFDKHLINFRDQYRVYETAMTQLIKSDCEAYPQNFYHLLDAVRNERQKVQKEVLTLHKIAGQYRKELSKFATDYKDGGSQGEVNGY